MNSVLYVKSSDEQQFFTLKHTQVAAKISGNLSRVEVVQSFTNPFTKPLEAVYIFPLPDEATVDEMEIKIGSITIKGDIKERSEAEEIYVKAKQEGRTAGLLEQERDNIFTQYLANIKPGEQIDVTIRYTDKLKFEAGKYEFVFPMVVGPRYIPGTLIDETGDTDRVPDASRITPPVVAQGIRSGHDIDVTVEIDSQLPVSHINSPSHQIQIKSLDNKTLVKLDKEDTIPNKDFSLRYQVADNKTQANLITQSDSRGGHFAVYLIPALEYSSDDIIPKDIVFLVDTSGSQQGEPLKQCQELMRLFIQGLNPNDTFSILDFSTQVRQLSRKPLPNNLENRSKALDYINNLYASGGTEMLNGINAAINFSTPRERIRSIILLTDGYIGNETEILATVQKNLQPRNRLHSFGVGSSVNRFLLNRIAEVGRGISKIIRHDESTQGITEFFQRINNPVLTDIQITWEGDGDSPVIYPEAPPDLFAEQPLILSARKEDAIAGNLRISANTGCERYEEIFNVNFDESAGNLAVAQLWGRNRIKYLTNQMSNYQTKAGVEAVTETALNYQLLSQYTAFVAVSDDVRVNSDNSISTQVAVEMPEAVSYQGTFGSSRGGGGLGFEFYPVSPVPGSFNKSPGRNRNKYDPRQDSGNTDWMEAAPPAPPINPGLQIINFIGLDEAAKSELIHHLQKQKLPEISGEIVFELKIKKGRIKQIIVDESASTIKDEVVINQIKQLLLSWSVPPNTGRKVVFTLRIM